MLKHGRVFTSPKAWTMRYLRSLREQSFDHPAHQIALQEMIEAVRLSKERAQRLETVIEGLEPTWSLAPVVWALQALRGIDLIVAVTFVTETGDLRRFENPRQLMGNLGLAPSERSTDDAVQRGGITKVGNGRVCHMLIESACCVTLLAKMPGRAFCQSSQGPVDPRQGPADSRQKKLQRYLNYISVRSFILNGAPFPYMPVNTIDRGR